MPIDVFKEMNNAIHDLQRATMQTYERPFSRLTQLLAHPTLAPFTEKLISGADIDRFVKESERAGGSMAGSHKLAWPQDVQQQLGLVILLIRRLSRNDDYFFDFCQQYFPPTGSTTSSISSFTSQVLVPFARDYEAFVRASGDTTLTVARGQSNRVFVVHGHDDGARQAVARFIERVGLEAVILDEQANRGRTVIEKVEANSDVGFAVVLLTPDDVGSVKGGVPMPRVRQNVLLELGYFIGRLGRERVCTLRRGGVEFPSDFLGVVWCEFDDAGAWRQRLAKELSEAGYDIDWNKFMTGSR